jgi:hypothetical protein
VVQVQLRVQVAILQVPVQVLVQVLVLQVLGLVKA